MNETVIEESRFAPELQEEPRWRMPTMSAFHGYGVLLLLVGAGWLLRDREWIDPEAGVGYWLGITGSSMMLALLLYPLRKRFRFMNVLGATRHWFRMHMIFGLVGPLLILFHCNFQLGSFNSQVAFYSMLLVAGSGIVGRHFYARIHRGLYGRKTSLTELQTDLATSVERGHGLATLMPELVKKLDAYSKELQECHLTRTIGVGRSLRWTFTHYFIRYSLSWTARRELKQAAAASETVNRDFKSILKSTSAYIGEYTTLLGRVAQFSFYERLFALWHVFHLPIFLMMVLSAVMHVLAVHMY